MHGHTGFEAFGHQAFSGGTATADIRASEHDFGATHDFEREAGRVVAGNHAGVGVAVFRGDIVGDVLGRDLLVRFEDCGEEAIAAACFYREEIGADRDACHAPGLVADDAACLKLDTSTGGVAGGGDGRLKRDRDLGARRRNDRGEGGPRERDD